MFERPVKQSLVQSPEAARRQTIHVYSVYSVLFTCTHQMAPLSRSANIVLPGSRKFCLPLSHLLLLFRVTPVEFMEKLYGS